MLSLQKELDIKKWLESEIAKKDLCSSYNYCTKCDKQKENPCALAFNAYFKKPKTATLSFQEKLDLAKDTTKDKYNLLIDLLKAISIKIRVCKKNVTLRYNKSLIGLITLTKNSLKLNLAVNPDSYEEIPHMDYSSKKTYIDVPFMIKLTSKKIINQSLTIIKKIIEI